MQFCSNHSLFFRLVSIIIIISFLCQDIVFALQPKSLVPGPGLKGEFRQVCEERGSETVLTADDKRTIRDAVSAVTDPVVRDVYKEATGVELPAAVSVNENTESHEKISAVFNKLYAFLTAPEVLDVGSYSEKIYAANAEAQDAANNPDLAGRMFIDFIISALINPKVNGNACIALAMTVGFLPKEFCNENIVDALGECLVRKDLDGKLDVDGFTQIVLILLAIASGREDLRNKVRDALEKILRHKDVSIIVCIAIIYAFGYVMDQITESCPGIIEESTIEALGGIFLKADIMDVDSQILAYLLIDICIKLENMGHKVINVFDSIIRSKDTTAEACKGIFDAIMNKQEKFVSIANLSTVKAVAKALRRKDIVFPDDKPDIKERYYDRGVSALINLAERREEFRPLVIKILNRIKSDNSLDSLLRKYAEMELSFPFGDTARIVLDYRRLIIGLQGEDYHDGWLYRIEDTIDNQPEIFNVKTINVFEKILYMEDISDIVRRKLAELIGKIGRRRADLMVTVLEVVEKAGDNSLPWGREIAGIIIDTLESKPIAGGDNIGKNVEYEIKGDKLTIWKKGRTEALAENCRITPAVGIKLDDIKELAGRLNVYKEFGEDFINFINSLKIMVFTGSEKSRAAGAFGHMEKPLTQPSPQRGEGILYIDEVLIKNIMAIIHEAIHAYLENRKIDAESRIKEIPLEGKIREKAGTDPAALRHYYARYYLQNTKAESKGYEGSENEELTNEIRINIIANELGISVDALMGLLNDLGKDDAVLRTKFLKMIKKDGVIESGEVEVLVKNIEKVKSVLDKLGGLVANGEKKEAIKRVALYLSIRDVGRMNELNELPKCMQKLAGRLVSTGVIVDDKTAEDLMHRMLKKDFYVADVYLRRIEEMGLRGEIVDTVRKYLFLRAQIGRMLDVDVKDIDAVTPATNIARYMQRYLRKNDNKGKIVEVLARYLLSEEEKSSLRIEKETENSIQRIVDAKKLADIQFVDGEDILTEFRNSLSAYAASQKETIIVFQHLSVYISGNSDWDRKNLDDNVIRLIRELIINRQLMFVYSDNEQKDSFKNLFREVSGEEINEDRFVNELDLDLSKTESIYVVKTKDQCKERDIGKTKVIVAGESGIVDLYLMWQITLARANRKELDEDFWREITNFLSEYYKDDALAQEAIAAMKKDSVYLFLPKAAPFIREYFDALVEARTLINRSA